MIHTELLPSPRPDSGSLLGLVAAVFALAGLAGSPAAGPAERQVCGVPYDGVRAEDFVHLVATALGDTVEVEQSMFGQAADVSRFSGPGAMEWNADLRDAGGTVLLIPWGFDDDCEPIQWTGAWRWSPTGAVGFYRERLRPPQQWIAGRPTLDVYRAVWEGFPHSPWEHPMESGLPKLTADELFDLYEALPTSEDLAERPYGAVSGLVDWRREAGVLAASYPARLIVESAFRLAEIARVRKSPLVFGGTYRIQIRADVDTLGTFLLRTGEGGSEPWPPSAVGDEVALAPAPTGAIAAPTALALTSEVLDSVSTLAAPSQCARLLGLRATEQSSDAEDAARIWSAEIPLSYITKCFEDEQHFGDLHPAQTPTTTDSGNPAQPFSGAFRQEEDGRFTFRQPAVLEDGRQVMLLGQRVGLETLPWVNPTDTLSP